MITMDYLDHRGDKAKAHIAALEKELLTDKGLFYRYKHYDDFGFPESTFLVCAFWYVDALACVGRVDDALRNLDQLLTFSNHLGIFSEDATADGSQWGNFPQTYSMWDSSTQPAVLPVNWTKRIFYRGQKALSWGMSSRLIYNIRHLVSTRMDSRPLRGAELAGLPVIDDAWLHLEGDRIAAYGPMSALPPDLALLKDIDASVDAAGCIVLPTWADSHTHLVFAGSRESEFVDKLRGLSYAEINAKGGGISTPPAGWPIPRKKCSLPKPGNGWKSSPGWVPARSK